MSFEPVTLQDDAAVSNLNLETHPTADDSKSSIPFSIFCMRSIVPKDGGQILRTMGFVADHAVLTKTDDLWDNGQEITYGFMAENGGTPAQRVKFQQCLGIWQKYVNITFRLPGRGEEAMIRVQFVDEAGAWSYVAKDNLSDEHRDPTKATMNLGSIHKSEMSRTPLETGVMLHEIGHALGMRHEHQSPSFRDVIDLKAKEQACIEFMHSSAKWPPDMAAEQILTPFSAEMVSNYTDVDLKSVMMYFMPAQMTGGIAISPNNMLSNLDKAFMRVHYPCFGAAEGQTPYKFSEALNTMKLDESTKTDILKEYKNGNWREIRERLRMFYDSGVRGKRNAELHAKLWSKIEDQSNR